MDKKTINFFRASIASVVIISILVFAGLTIFMSRKTEASIEEISYTYMDEVCLQIQQKFQSIIDLRLKQVEGHRRLMRFTMRNCSKSYGSARRSGDFLIWHFMQGKTVRTIRKLF